jgi:hypothetical protein
MLGISLSKILFTILLAIVVWRAFKMVGPLISRMQGAPPSRRAQGRPTRPAAGAKADARAVELVACPHCGTFVPKTTMCPSRDHCRLQRA